MNTYFPQFKALWTSEIVTGTIHNIYDAARCPGSQRAELVEGNQRGPVQVRAGSRGHVCLA